MWNKIIDYIGIDKIRDYFIELLDYYFRPFLFFSRFSKKKLPEKLIQTILYSVFTVLISYILLGNTPILRVVKILLREIFVLIGIISSLLISEIIIARIINSKPRFEDIVLFIILSKILIGPFEVIFYGMFLHSENYDYYFLSNLVVLFLTIYILFFSSFIFNRKLKIIFLQIFFNLLTINVVFYLVSKLSIDEYSANENEYGGNVILKERLNVGRLIKEPYTTPNYLDAYFYNDDQVVVLYLFSSPFDSLATGGNERNLNYYNNIKSNLLVLDTINLNFKRNKEYFNILKKQQSKIDSTINEDAYTTFKNLNMENFMKEIKYNSNDSLMIDKIWRFKLTHYLKKFNDKILEYDNELMIKSHYAELPLKYRSYLFPLIRK